MKVLLILIVSLSFLIAGPKVSNFKLKDLNNKTTSFNKIKGEKLTIIDFWATWCKPCLQAIPKLNKISEKYKDKGVVLIGINTDSPRNAAKVKPFSKSYKINYIILRDPNSEIAAEMNVNSYPTLYILNEEDEIVYTHIGFRPGDEEQIVHEIDKLLAENEE